MLNEKRKVVITGIGPVAPLGIGKELFWQGLEENEINLRKSFGSIDEFNYEKFYLHKVPNFDLSNFGIEKNKLDYVKRWKEGEENVDLNLFVAASKLALDDAHINCNFNKNLSIVVSHENPGIEQLVAKILEESFSLSNSQKKIKKQDFILSIYQKIEKLAYETQSFMLLFHLARIFDVHNYSIYINNACASGLYAIEAANDIIQSGKAKIVLVVAGDCPDIFKYLWFKNLGMYSSDGKIRPFSKGNQEGIVLGEGASAIILEDYDHAKKRNANIYAEYVGGGFDLEGWGVTTPMIGGSSLSLTIKNALSLANIDMKGIDLICAHGVGTRASDYYELKSLSNLLGNKQTPITAFKPYLGHNLGGSALLELILLILCMKNNYVPPIMNTKDFIDEFKINLVKEKFVKELDVVLKICTAFAGQNASIILKKVTY